MKYFKAPVFSMNFSESKSGMKLRFSNILNLERKRAGKGILAICVLSVFMVGGLVGCKDNELRSDSNVEPEIQLSSAKDLETAIVQSIFDFNKGKYYGGECKAEGHIVLGNEGKIDADTNEEVENYVYALVSYGEYGFENGIFTKVSGSGAIPTRFTFRIDNDGKYELVEYKEAEDGSRYTTSIREMFPDAIAERALHYTDFDSEKLSSLEEQYAKEYLLGINRSDADIKQNVTKDLAKMNVEASNALLDLFYDYPYWIGTEEKIEDDVRYVYEKQWEDKGNGDGIVTFKKYEYDTENVVDETVIEIKDGKLEYLKGEVRTGRI